MKSVTFKLDSKLERSCRKPGLSVGWHTGQQYIIKDRRLELMLQFNFTLTNSIRRELGWVGL